MLFRSTEGRHFQADIEVDQCVYRAPRQNDANTTRVTSGVDFYAYTTVFGKAYYYAVCWSGWPTERIDYRSLTDEEQLLLDEELLLLAKKLQEQDEELLLLAKKLQEQADRALANTDLEKAINKMKSSEDDK